MKNQLTIFDIEPDFSDKKFDYTKGEFIEEGEEKEEIINETFFQKAMSALDEIVADTERTGLKIKALLDEVQKDWTEEEKLKINNPKEWERQQKLKKEQEPKPQIEMKELTQEAIETLKQSKVEGNIVKLPEGQLDRKIYMEVKNRLELIGGKWKGNKIMGFVFNECPAELLEQIANGEKRNLKKEFQFFATPSGLADELVSYAEIHNSHKILEPSAGQGAIINAIHKVAETVPVDYCETMGVNLTILQRMKNVNAVGGDFLQFNGMSQYDRIIANPPFSKNQDVQHIYKMYDCLKVGGRLVSIASKHWQNSTNKTETEFKKWLGLVKAEIHEIEAGAFKESGTSIASVIIIINK